MENSAVIDLFCGAGGLGLGFAQAGLPPVLSVDADVRALKTHTANLNSATLRADMARDVGIVVEAAHDMAGSRDFVVIGGAPCQGFSSAGRRDPDDPRSRLVASWLEVVRALRPTWFLFENVEGILTTDGGRVLHALLDDLTREGYVFDVRRLDFAALGLPQARRRVVVVGNRLGVPFRLPDATHAYGGMRRRSLTGIPSPTVLEALAGLPEHVAASADLRVPYVSELPLSDWDARMRHMNGTDLHVTASAVSTARCAMLAQGQSMRDLPETEWPESFRRRANRRVSDGTPSGSRGGAPHGLRRLRGDHAALTVTSATSREAVHPIFDRTLTLRECARLQGFPDGFGFTGSRADVARQIGNAVPPPMGELLARAMMTAERV